MERINILTLEECGLENIIVSFVFQKSERFCDDAYYNFCTKENYKTTEDRYGKD